MRPVPKEIPITYMIRQQKAQQTLAKLKNSQRKSKVTKIARHQLEPLIRFIYICLIGNQSDLSSVILSYDITNKKLKYSLTFCHHK